jgi:hypothetical protein
MDGYYFLIEINRTIQSSIKPIAMVIMPKTIPIIAVWL